MGSMSFTRELKTLAKASEEMDAGGCWQEMIFLHRELGRQENALGRRPGCCGAAGEGGWRGASSDLGAGAVML